MCSFLSIRASCTPSHPSRHHVSHLIHPSTMCSTAPSRYHVPHLTHPSTMCSTAPSRHQEVPVPRATVQLLPNTNPNPQPAHQTQAQPCATQQGPADRSAGTLGIRTPRSHLHEHSLHAPDHNYVSSMLEGGSGASTGCRHHLSAADPCLLGQKEIEEPSLPSLAWRGHC